MRYSQEQKHDLLDQWFTRSQEVGWNQAARELKEEHGIDKTTLYAWKAKLRPSEVEEKLEDSGLEQTNWTAAWVKDKHVSVYVKNNNIPTVEDLVNQFVESIQEYKGEYQEIKREPVEEGYLLVFDPADIHIGKLATLSFTENEYNVEIAKQKVIDGMYGVLQKASGFEIDKVLLVIGNDALHIDNPKRTTTSGTPQDTSSTWFDCFIEARKLYVRMIEALVQVADVEVIFNPSNHDYMSGAMLADSLKSWFKDCPNISFNCDMRHRKYLRYGNSLIGTSHGDGAKEKDLGELMAHEAKELWAKTEYRYWYLHHVHHKVAKDRIGYTIEYLRSSSPADRWHSDNGYINQPACEGFIHSKKHGQIARLTHYV